MPDLSPGCSYTATALIDGLVGIDNVGRYQCPLRMGAAHRGGKEVNTRLSKIVRGIQQLGGVKPVKETQVSMTETLNGESFPAGLRSFSQMTFR